MKLSDMMRKNPLLVMGRLKTMQVMTDYKGRQIKITRCPFPETIRGKVRGLTSHDKDGFFVVIDSTRGKSHSGEH